MRRKSIDTIDDPIDLSRLAAAIRASSNFRFGWQFYRVRGFGEGTRADVRAMLEAVIATSELHAFLRKNNRGNAQHRVEVKPLHAHAAVVQTAGEFEDVLAGAAADQLGAYSRSQRRPTARQRSEVAVTFGSIGPYRAFELKPGEMPGCERCKHHDNHLFSDWFYGVAWDWCLFAWWLERETFWIGCLTDTD